MLKKIAMLGQKNFVSRQETTQEGRSKELSNSYYLEQCSNYIEFENELWIIR